MANACGSTFDVQVLSELQKISTVSLTAWSEAGPQDVIALDKKRGKRSDQKDKERRSKRLSKKRQKHKESTSPRKTEDKENDDENKKQNEMDKIMEELLTTEKSYSQNLQKMISVYEEPLKDVLKPEEHKAIFGNVKAVSNLSKSLLERIDGLDKRCGNDEILGVIAVMLPFYKIYGEYCTNHTQATHQLRLSLAKNEKFRAFCETILIEEKAQPLASFLILPVQRVPRLRLMLSNMLECCDESSSQYEQMKRAVDGLEGVAVDIEDHMFRIEQHYRSWAKIEEIYQTYSDAQNWFDRFEDEAVLPFFLGEQSFLSVTRFNADGLGKEEDSAAEEDSAVNIITFSNLLIVGTYLDQQHGREDIIHVSRTPTASSTKKQTKRSLFKSESHKFELDVALPLETSFVKIDEAHPHIVHIINPTRSLCLMSRDPEEAKTWASTLQMAIDHLIDGKSKMIARRNRLSIGKDKVSGLYLAEEVLAPSYVLNQISLEEVSEVTKDITEWETANLDAYVAAHPAVKHKHQYMQRKVQNSPAKSTKSSGTPRTGTPRKTIPMTSLSST